MKLYSCRDFYVSLKSSFHPKIFSFALEMSDFLSDNLKEYIFYGKELNMHNSKKKSKLSLMIFGLLFLIIVSFFVFMQTPFSKVNLRETEVYLELGHSPEKSPSYYLDGNAFSILLSYVDISSVEKDTPGQYPITIYHGFDTHTCIVTVSDTEAPELSCDIQTKTVLPGENITIDKLGVRTQDHSEIKYVGFTKIQSDHFYTGLSDYEMLTDMYASYREGISFYSKEFQFAYGGTYTLTIEACDLYDNKNSVDLTIIVEEPPVIEAPADFYIAVGSELDYETYIDAWDLIDEKFNYEDIEIDSSSVSLATAGEYPVYFAATDDYGLSSTAVSRVHVLQKDDLQNLINTHQINIDEHAIVGAYNAYDLGYFEDCTLDNHGNKSTYYAVAQSIVRVSNLRDETFGNGFIVKIDDDMVTICTCAHVTEDCVTPKITFRDGTVRFGAVVGQDPSSDVAFICIPIDGNSEKSSLSSDYVKNLRTIHIDETYWKALADDADIRLGYVCLDKNGHFRYTANGRLIKKDVKKNWNNYENVHQMLVDMEAQPGSSGSAIFDESGRLLGMIRGHSKHKDGTVEKVGVPLSEILRQYELIFKKKLQYK